METTRNMRILFAAVTVITVAIFLPALGNGFVNWDDDVYVYDNYHLRSLDGAFFRWALTDRSVVYWHPVTWFSHALDVALWGLHPAGHHLTAIILHGINTFLVMYLVLQVLQAAHARSTDEPFADVRRRERFSLIAAGATGLLFGIHPLRVESVVWIAERKDLLSALFFLLALSSYLKASLPAREGGRMSAPVRRSLPFVWYLLAVASKPMALTLPVVLLLADWYPLGRLRSRVDVLRLLREKVPYFAVSLIVAGVTISAQREVGATPSLELVSLKTRVLVAAGGLTGYLGKMILPLGLEPLYLHPRMIASIGLAHIAQLAFLAGVTVLTLLWARRRPAWLAAWAWYVVTVLPVLGFVQAGSQSMADRFTYLPGIAPTMLAGAGIAEGWELLVRRGLGGRVRSVALAIALSVGAALAAETVAQTGIWKDSVVFWSAVIAKEPERFPAAYSSRATALYDRGEREAARRDIDRAIALDPGFAEAYASRGWMLRREGNLDSAAADLTTAIRLKPAMAEAYVSRGIILGEKGEYARSIDDFTMAIALKPDLVAARVARGLALLRAGRPLQAVEDLNAAIGMSPADTDAYLNRGAAYEELGQWGNAFADYDRVVRIDPGDAAGDNARGGAAARLGRTADAIADQTKAIGLRPDFAKAYFDRGQCYIESGQRSPAQADFRQACELGYGPGCAER